MLLEFARALAASERETAFPVHKATLRRTVINRAYYATFHALKSYILLVLREESPEGNEHSWILRTLRRSPGKRDRLIGSLEQLQKSRIEADYNLSWSDSALESAFSSAIELADKVIKAFPVPQSEGSRH